MPFLQSSYSTPWNVPNRNDSICLHEDWDTNAHQQLNESHKLQYLCDRYQSTTKKNKLAIYATTNIYAEWNNLEQEKYLMYVPLIENVIE